MAYVKLTTLSIFLLATFVMLPMKNVAAVCFWPCLQTFSTATCPNSGCICMPLYPIPGSACVANTYKDAARMIGDAKLCRSDDECEKKGMGSYCALHINPNGDYGWCFASESEAEIILAPKSEASKSTYAEDFLRMPLPMAA